MPYRFRKYVIFVVVCLQSIFLCFSSIAQESALVPTPLITLQGIQLDWQQPLMLGLKFSDIGLNPRDVEEQSTRLMRYFLTALTTPDQDLWVNLSPYEQNRIVASDFAKTEMGRDLLQQDYALKQLTATLMDPHHDVGRIYWQQIYQQAFDLYGTQEVPINQIHKVWIVPDQASVDVDENAIYVSQARLKVRLAIDDHTQQQLNVTHHDDDFVTATMREIVVPAIEKQVNESDAFSALRQIYRALILAKYMKQQLKSDDPFQQYFIDQKKNKGMHFRDGDNIPVIYQRYVQLFQEGSNNKIVEEYSEQEDQTLLRHYFLGGVSFEKFPVPDNAQMSSFNKMKTVFFNLNPIQDQAMMIQLGQSLDLVFEKQSSGLIVRRKNIFKTGGPETHDINYATTLLRDYLGLNAINMYALETDKHNVISQVAHLGQQPTGSFKPWIAYGIVEALIKKSHLDTIVTATTGNQGIAVSYIVKALKEKLNRPVDVFIYISEGVPQNKINQMKRNGATIVALDDKQQAFTTYEKAYEAALAHRFSSEYEGRSYFVRHADIDAITGYAALAHTSLNQLFQDPHYKKEETAVIVPVGAGGLSAGYAAAIARYHPDVKLILVHTELTRHTLDSFVQGKLVPFYNDQTQPLLENGIDTKSLEPAVFKSLYESVDGVVMVSSKDIPQAIGRYFNQQNLYVEGAGVLPYLALPQLQKQFQQWGIKNTLLVATGGNIDTHLVHQYALADNAMSASSDLGGIDLQHIDQLVLNQSRAFSFHWSSENLQQMQQGLLGFSPVLVHEINIDSASLTVP